MSYIFISLPLVFKVFIIAFLISLVTNEFNFEGELEKV